MVADISSLAVATVLVCAAGIYFQTSAEVLK
jgi:hypothetical protein